MFLVRVRVFVGGSASLFVVTSLLFSSILIIDVFGEEGGIIAIYPCTSAAVCFKEVFKDKNIVQQLANTYKSVIVMVV